MKTLLISLLIFMPFAQRCETYYMAVNGNDANNGSISTPFKSFAKFKAVATEGDTLFVRGGTYRTAGNAATSNHFVIEDLAGTAANPIVITNYPGESPIFNLDNITPTYADPTAMVIDGCNYLHIKGLRITGLKQIKSGAGVSRGIDLRNVTNSKFELIELDHIGGYGFILSNGTNDNLFLNCDAHHMDDRYTTDGGAWGNANGFQCTGGSNATRNTFDGCRAWWISDDGFDLYSTNGIVTFKNCWAFWNGYEPGTFTKRGDGSGFKLGPMNSPLHNTITRTLMRCFAFENASSGFNQNNGDTRYQVYNCTSFNNPDYGFIWDYVSPAPTQDFKNNISFQDGTARRGTETNGVTNSWNLSPAPNISYFQSLSSSGADGARQADGSLPNLPFMHLENSNPYIDAGTDVGIPYSGSAPDLGAFETQPTNVPEILMCGNLPLKLPAANTYLCGSVKSGTGEAPFSYQWEMISGPSTVAFSSPTGADTYISNFVAGTYQIKLTVTDANSNVGFGFVTVVVLPGPEPTHFKILTAKATATGINIAWSAQLSSLSKSFKIERRKFRRFETIATKAAKAEGKMVDNPASGTYTYRIVALDSDGTTVTGPEAIVTYKKKASLILQL